MLVADAEGLVCVTMMILMINYWSDFLSAVTPSWVTEMVVDYQNIADCYSILKPTAYRHFYHFLSSYFCLICLHLPVSL